MPPLHQTILIHRLAPQKPRPGMPCNGCGVCCLSEPCPLGVLLSRRRRGACDALRWSEGGLLYRCGAINEPQDVLSRALPRWLRPIAIGLSPLMARLAKRWIAAGLGCDTTLEVATVVAPTKSAGNSPTIPSTLIEPPSKPNTYPHPSP